MPDSFTARLAKGTNKGAWTCVIVPGVKEKYGTGGLVKVKGTIDGESFETSLMPQGDGTHRLPIKKDLQDAIGKRAGDTVEVSIEPR